MRIALPFINKFTPYVRHRLLGMMAVGGLLVCLGGQLTHAACVSSFTLNWSDASTYSVTCGTVIPSGWKVSNERCTYSSPNLGVGVTADGSSRQVDLVLRINQSGNLDADDSAKIRIFVNGSIYSTTLFVGNNSNAVFSISPSLWVPSGGSYQVEIELYTNASNEFWTIKSGDFTTCVVEPTPLPVSLVDYGVREEISGEATVSWVTQSERINDYFTVERSQDGDVFEVLAKVDGAGNSNEIRYYQHQDTEPLPGLSYYRLSQTDYDGTVTVCGLLSFRLEHHQAQIPVIALRNNPFKDQVSIALNTETASRVFIRLLSSSGEESFKTEFPVQSSREFLDIAVPGNLNPGIYTLIVVTDSGEQLVTKAVRK